jgi:hypothetical protein
MYGMMSAVLGHSVFFGNTVRIIIVVGCGYRTATASLTALSAHVFGRWLVPRGTKYIPL